MPRSLLILLSLCSVLLVSGCSSVRYEYHYVRGKTATLNGGLASAPESAPDAVQAAIAAGNRIAGLPYGYGGGRCDGVDKCYDCSGAASYVLREAGLLRDWETSSGFRRYGSSGLGKWISVYAKSGHVFLVVAGLRFDTGWHDHNEGPRWTMKSRPARGYNIRHPSGL